MPENNNSNINVKKTFDEYKADAITMLACLGAIFHIYNLGFSMINMWSYRLSHVAIAMILVFLGKPLFGKEHHKKLDFILNIGLIVVLMVIVTYIFIERPRLEMYMSFAPTQLDVIICIIGVLFILEFTRRANGMAMPILAIGFLAYAFLGQYIPGRFGHGGYTIKRIATFLFSLDGIFGTTIGTSATYVILFVIFGSVLQGTGGGKLFIDAAIKGLGKYRGGPAKAAVVASALMGMISGSSAANVCTTGAFTIPLMKEVGYKKDFAGAVEAVASTGGQIMPPIMGAGAFLMAEAIGIPYMSVAAAAAIPAVLYFFSVFVSVDLEAVKTGLKGVPKEALPNMKETWRDYGLLIFPLLFLLYLLIFTDYSVVRSALWCIYACLLIALIKKSTRYGIKKFIEIMAEGMQDCVGVIAACACAGIIVGVLTLTGLGNSFVSIILAFSGGHLLIALFLVMIITIILGMGLPTTASYIVCSSVVVPALLKMGLTPLPAHMFVFYFACLSSVTPPVAIAAYAAAGISGGSVNTTGWTAFRLALVAFIIPYMFVYGNALLLIGTIPEIILAVITALIGVFMFSAAMCNWFVHRTNIFIRALLILGSLLLILQGALTDAIGIAVVVVCFLYQKYVNKGVDDKIDVTKNYESN